MAQYNEKITKAEAIDLLKAAQKYMIEDTTKIDWKREFILKQGLSETIISMKASKDEDIAKEFIKTVELWKQNVIHGVQEGRLKEGFSKWLLQCSRGKDVITETEELQHEKMRAEIENLKANTELVNEEIRIGFDDE